MTEKKKVITLKEYTELKKAKEDVKVLRKKLLQHCPELESWLNLRFPIRERD